MTKEFSSETKEDRKEVAHFSGAKNREPLIANTTAGETILQR